MNAPVRINPYLAGNFAPDRQRGRFSRPGDDRRNSRGLSGTFYRNGPNPQFPPRDQNHHWFAGDGMLHAFFVSNGKVSYRNRYVRTPKWELEHAGGQGVVRNVRQSDDDRSRRAGEGQRCRQHQYRLARGKVARARRRSPAVRSRSRNDLEPRGYVPYAGRADDSRRIPRSIPKRARWCSSAMASATCRCRPAWPMASSTRTGKVTRLDTFRGALCEHGSRFSRDQEPCAVSRSCRCPQACSAR